MTGDWPESMMVIVCGPSVPDCSLNVGQRERSVVLHEFLARHKTNLTNTWTDEVNVEHMFTRRDWKERTEKGAAAQIDFVAASHSLNMTQSAVDGHTDISSDHFMVYAEFSGPGLPVKRESPRKPPSVCADGSAEGEAGSGGSQSPDLGDTWRQGCPTSPEWISSCSRCMSTTTSAGPWKSLGRIGQARW